MTAIEPCAREYVVVILGAGASSCVPQTDTMSLTKTMVDAKYSYRKDKYPVYKWLQAIDKSNNTTFEKLMAEAWRFKEDIKRTHSIPYALRRYMPGWEPAAADGLLSKSLSEVARHIGMHLYEALKEYHGPTPVTDFLDALARKTPIIVGTLNYDDLILRGDTTYDYGFTDSLFDYEFSQRSIEARAEHSSLLWLHGSIHLNRQFKPERPGELVWMDDAKASLHGWVQGFRDAIFDFPIVIATDKPAQVIQTPFIDYWHVLNHALRMAKVVVVIGYSGNDEHLNRLLSDVTMLRRRNISIVWSTKTNPERENPEDGVIETLYKVFPVFINRLSLHDVVLGQSLQTLIDLPASVPCPRFFVDMDGIEDLAGKVDSVLNLL